MEDDTTQTEEKVIEQDGLAHVAEENAAKAHEDAAAQHKENAGANK
ncbi:MAG: hypothetical protein WC244_02260 [Patescibacteria group bacterium]|jgi:hypothetical protein